LYGKKKRGLYNLFIFILILDLVVVSFTNRIGKFKIKYEYPEFMGGWRERDEQSGMVSQ
jgi:hypothetical protein